jgi:hypothetical protein
MMFVQLPKIPPNLLKWLVNFSCSFVCITSFRKGNTEWFMESVISDGD